MNQKLNGIKIAFLTLGCKVNSYETEAMMRLFREQGAELVSFEEAARVYVVNTCTVTQIADRKSRQMLHRAKKKNPSSLVVAVGCYAQEAGEGLLLDGAVDLVIGNNQKSRVAELVTEALEGNIRHAREELQNNTEYESLFVSDISEKTRAYIKIQDGCNQFCSYCIIPYVRGRIRSREPKEVLFEVEELTKKGFQEIVLTGIHLSSYGNEAAVGGRLDGSVLSRLILTLNEIPGLKRIRLGSLEPRIITEEFVERISKADKLCPHFHLSLQSGCDATLLRMNRKYTTAEYAKACERLRRAFDTPAITTDVIVGFPGETEEEFSDTKRFLEEIRFAKMHIFRYSVRKGTRAENMPGQIPETVKAERSEQLLALEKKMRNAYMEELLGKELEVLTEETIVVDKTTFLSGHSKRYAECILEPLSGLQDGSMGENVIRKGIAKKIIKDGLIYVK